MSRDFICIFTASTTCYQVMIGMLRSIAISTIIVVGYPIVVLAVVWPLGVLCGGPYATSALSALMMPLGLPGLIMRLIYPSATLYGGMQIDTMLLMLGWFISFNSVLYYIPVRLFLDWREQRTRLR